MSDTVRVTYIGSSSRRRARGKTESYWFGRQTSRRIPATDVEAVTGRDPSNWRVEWPKVQAIPVRDTPQPPRRRPQGVANKTARSPRPPVNEE